MRKDQIAAADSTADRVSKSCFPVSACLERWGFHAVGEPLPEEDLASCSLRRTRDRLNEKGMPGLLERLGARPWDDDFYRAGDALRIERVAYPNKIIQKRFPDFASERAV